MLRKILLSPITYCYNKNLKTSVLQKQLKYGNILKYNTAASTITFDSNFSPNQEEKILATINDSNSEELGRWVVKYCKINI